MKNRKGFTLAEVLITLGIIGVVAAMTIPTLMANNQKTQYVTGLKKAYSQVNQALAQMAIDNGCPGDLKCTGLFHLGDSTSLQKLGAEFVKYFRVAKNCERQAGKGCFSDKISGNYDGSGVKGDWLDIDSSAYKFVTLDGAAFGILFPTEDATLNCNYDSPNSGINSYTPDVPIQATCAQLTIDVNGLKPPNNYGRDIFAFYITNMNAPVLYPYGGSDFGDIGESWKIWTDGNETCNNINPDKNGAVCTGRIVEEGWQMNY